ncbi:DNA polymerase [Shewanella frigidimarina]|uniref:DNA polymerase n=1 Tax=Shewanella frigidimarina TaxID=56812 RepID=UPI00247A14B6|nr:DNA polymerase [Shewanella frigidimarina]
MASEEFVKNTYHGGVNNCHQIGPTTIETWYDYDAQSCYTTALNGIKTLDYANTFMSTKLEDYCEDVMGFARVKFEFPKGTCYPSLPIRTDKYGLVYPLKGVSWCTSHELVVANTMGATLKILQGFVIPWADENHYVFREFMQLVRAKRKEYKASNNIFYEKLWKEIGNSLYGKLAQGLRCNKTGFDIFLQYSKKLPPSAITNGYYASYTTGLARALMFEQMVSIGDKYEIVSVTTDGYLTNAPMSEIKLDGSISNLFRKFFHVMNGNTTEEIIEEKHRVMQLISMKTRGQLTAIPIDTNPVLARAGVQVRIKKKDEKLGSLKLDQNDYFTGVYLGREPGQKHERKSLISTRKMFTHQTDMVSVETEQRLNLEADFKRNLVNPKMRAVLGTEHIHLDTQPFETIEDMLYARIRFDVWRKNNCLKTLVDWDSWQEFYLMSLALCKIKMRLKDGEHSGHLLLRLFLRAYGQAELGLQGDEYTRKELVAKFADWGYSYKTSDFTPAKKAPLYLGVVPRTERSSHLASLLLSLFPDFDVESLYFN